MPLNLISSNVHLIVLSPGYEGDEELARFHDSRKKKSIILSNESENNQSLLKLISCRLQEPSDWCKMKRPLPVCVFELYRGQPSATTEGDHKPKILLAALNLSVMQLLCSKCNSLVLIGGYCKSTTREM